MEDQKKWKHIFALVLVALIFSILSIYLPWWSVRTTREVEITNGTATRAGYALSQTVAASKTVGDETQSVIVSIMDLPGEQVDKNVLSSLLNTTRTITIAGVALTALTLLLTLISGLRKQLFRYLQITGIAAAVLLAGASLYLASEMPNVIHKLGSVIPTEISELPGQTVTGFWSGIRSPGLQTWIWGAALGWFLAFTASLIVAGVVILIFYNRKM